MAAAGMTMVRPTLIPSINPMVSCSLPNPTYKLPRRRWRPSTTPEAAGLRGEVLDGHDHHRAAGVEEDSAPSGVKHEP
jgi:hypothetical protein